MDAKQLWSGALAQLELEISTGAFKTWFKDTFILKLENGALQLAVPNTFVKDWLQNKFHKNILQALRNVNDQVRSLEYVVSSKKKDEVPAQEIPETNTTSNELPLSPIQIDTKDNLNPRYTFESFVVGPFNELAHAAAQAIIKKPVAYNPLFIYGNTGLGKTHLMQSVGNHYKNHHKDKRVYYVTSEKFTNDYVNAVQNGKMAAFKEKYRVYDVFIMDDIQFMSNKEKTQEELFHLFNYLYDNNKQIVFSSDVHPNYLQNLEDRLKSRFMAGMIVDISPIDTESKMAILQAKARLGGFNMSGENISFLASSVDGSIRELEGVLNTIICQSQLKGRELNQTEIKALTKNSHKPHKTVSVKDVVRAVCAFYGIEDESLYNKTRRQEVVKPRQIVMYILREDFNISFPSIGQKLGGRDHTTVIHSCEKIKNELKTNPELQNELSQIRATI